MAESDAVEKLVPFGLVEFHERFDHAFDAAMIENVIFRFRGDRRGGVSRGRRGEGRELRPLRRRSRFPDRGLDLADGGFLPGVDLLDDGLDRFGSLNRH